jgi:hypothetical protein
MPVRLWAIPKVGLPQRMVVATGGGGWVSARSAEGVEDFARDVALEAAHDLALGLPFRGSALGDHLEGSGCSRTSSSCWPHNTRLSQESLLRPSRRTRPSRTSRLIELQSR